MEQLKHLEIIQSHTHFSITDNADDQSSSVLRLIYEFQNQLSIEELFAVYVENIRSVLPVNGIRYRFPLLGVHLENGSTHHPICNYQLNTEHEVWGDITIYQDRNLSGAELHQFELITSLLVHPLKTAIIHASGSLYANDGGIIGYANPDLVDQLITREAKLATREHVPMSIILFNTDRFKNVCTRLGHVHGDKILYDIMQVMHKKVRETDLLFRHHADTFCLILKGVTGKQATIISERVRSSIDMFQFTQPHNKRLHITISAGIAELVATDSLDSILARANNALLLAKKAGRNQSILADGIFLN